MSEQPADQTPAAPAYDLQHCRKMAADQLVLANARYLGGKMGQLTRDEVENSLGLLKFWLDEEAIANAAAEATNG